MKGHITYITAEQLGGTPRRNARAARVGKTVYFAGQVGRDIKTGTIAPGIREQTALALDNVEQVLRAAGATLDDIVKYTVYLVREEDVHGASEVLQERFRSPTAPPGTILIIKALALPGLLIEIEPIAVIGA